MQVKIQSQLKQLAQKKGVPLRQVAKEIGMTNSWESVRRFANNQTTNYSKPLLEKLLVYFDCRLEDLLSDGLDKPRDPAVENAIHLTAWERDGLEKLLLKAEQIEELKEFKPLLEDIKAKMNGK